MILLQEFKEINGSDYMSRSREVINNNFKSVASNFSGESFPATNLYEGMMCYRRDYKKLYVLANDLRTWEEFLSVVDGRVYVPNAYGADELKATHVYDLDKGNGSIVVKSRANGEETSKNIPVGTVKSVNNIEPDKAGNVKLASIENSNNANRADEAVIATKAISDSKGNVIYDTYAKIAEIGYWKPKETVGVDTVRYLRGAKYSNYYLKCVLAGTTGTDEPDPIVEEKTMADIVDGTVKWQMFKRNDAITVGGMAISALMESIKNGGYEITFGTATPNYRIKYYEKSVGWRKRWYSSLGIKFFAPEGYDEKNCKVILFKSKTTSVRNTDSDGDTYYTDLTYVSPELISVNDRLESEEVIEIQGDVQTSKMPSFIYIMLAKK